MKTRKRSNAPIFWGLFGAGGMLAALFGPMLVLITGVLVPMGLLLPADTMDYPKMHAFAQNFIGALQLFIVSFELFNALSLISRCPIIGQISFKLLNPSAQCFWCTAKLAGNGHCGGPLSWIFTALFLIKANRSLTDFR